MEIIGALGRLTGVHVACPVGPSYRAVSLEAPKKKRMDFRRGNYASNVVYGSDQLPGVEPKSSVVSGRRQAKGSWRWYRAECNTPEGPVVPPLTADDSGTRVKI